MLPAHPPAIAVRISIVMLVLTFIDDGLREFKDVPAQCGYLENMSNNIHMPHWAAMLYVLWSLAVQLGAGGYMLVYAVASPGARLLLPHPSSGPWRHIRVALWLLAAFVSSSVVVYGFGQPASQHAQGRLVFVLRNLGILGGVLLLLGTGTGSRPAHGGLLLLARAMLAGHGLELAPVNSIAVLSIVDIVVLPFALALLLGLQTHASLRPTPIQPYPSRAPGPGPRSPPQAPRLTSASPGAPSRWCSRRCSLPSTCRSTTSGRASATTTTSAITSSRTLAS